MISERSFGCLEVTHPHVPPNRPGTLCILSIVKVERPSHSQQQCWDPVLPTCCREQIGKEAMGSGWE